MQIENGKLSNSLILNITQSVILERVIDIIQHCLNTSIPFSFCSCLTSIFLSIKQQVSHVRSSGEESVTCLGGGKAGLTNPSRHKT